MFAIVQDGVAIHGIGATKAEAIADAIAWGCTADLSDLPRRALALGDFYLAPCTEALAEAVRTDGGDITFWLRVDGVVCLPDEDR